LGLTGLSYPSFSQATQAIVANARPRAPSQANLHSSPFITASKLQGLADEENLEAGDLRKDFTELRQGPDLVNQIRLSQASGWIFCP
jgi:hypothetical protein